jgi:hypothetical protein
VTPAIWLDHGKRYAQLGWRVFPLHGLRNGACTCGDADCRSPAKHPMTLHGVKNASADLGQLEAWAAQYPESNLGLALSDGLVAVDTDPRNGGDATLETLLEAHGPFPDTVMAMTGGGGTHHLFYNGSGRRVPGKLGRGVDIKAEGGYIVVEPSVHVSGTAYCWEASCDPLDGMRVAPLPDWIGAIEASAPAIAAGRGMIPAQQAVELRAAMAHLDADDRDTWVAVGMALHSTDAPNAFGMWTEWSQLSEKYDPADQRRVWASFAQKPGQRNVTSIFAMATAKGWVNPASAMAQRFDHATEAAIEQANGRSRIELVNDAPLSAQEPFPVPALEGIADWINSRYSIVHPDVTRQGVLALASVAAARVYVGEGGTACHLCLGVVAESTVLTAYIRDAIARILDDAGLRRMMRGTRANVPSNVYSTLWRSPAAIHVIADYGHLAQFAKRQPSGVLDQAFSVMADAYTAGSMYIDSPQEAGLKPSTGDDQLVIHAPALTTVLLSTHSQMGALLQRGELSRGLLAYQLPVIVDTAGAMERETSTEPTPPWIRDALRAVRRLPAAPGDLSQAEIFGQQPGARPNLVKVRFAVDFAEYHAAIAGVSGELEHRPLVLAGQQTARRIATTLGAWSNPQAPIASREVMAWSTAYVIRHLRAWLERFSTLGNDGEVDVGQKVVQAVADRRSLGIPRSHVHRYCRAFRSIRDKEKRDRLIDGLIEDEDLVEFVPEGTRQKVLVAKRFARRVEMKVVA